MCTVCHQTLQCEYPKKTQYKYLEVHAPHTAIVAVYKHYKVHIF